MNKRELELKAKQILQEAKNKGLTDNFLFTTTFERYVFQLSMIDEIQQQILSSDTLVEKEYIKNRKNVVVNPLIRAYNSICNEANKTLTTLLKVIDSFGKSDGKKDDNTDILLDIINGSNDD